MYFVPVFSLLFYFSKIVSSWDLTSYNISSDYYVSSIAVFGNRAFLALPRSSCYNNQSNPTLVEASWYSEQITVRKFPFFLESQTWNNCEHLQDVISIDMETIRSRLWVLDRGNENCPPKIVIYNLFQKFNYSLEIPESNAEKLNYLLVDTDVKLNGARGYIGLDKVSYILVFSILKFKWWKIHLQSDSLLPISTKFLAFARKEPILFITGGEERGIFALNLIKIRKDLKENENVTVTYLGEKLGNSSGLVADYKDGLSYYMPRDYAVVRWHIRKQAQAEYYNVLAQSYEFLPYVAQLFTGPQNGIWALVNLGDPDECPFDAPRIQKRLLKLLKYNVFF